MTSTQWTSEAKARLCQYGGGVGRMGLDLESWCQAPGGHTGGSPGALLGLRAEGVVRETGTSSPVPLRLASVSSSTCSLEEGCRAHPERWLTIGDIALLRCHLPETLASLWQRWEGCHGPSGLSPGLLLRPYSAQGGPLQRSQRDKPWPGNCPGSCVASEGPICSGILHSEVARKGVLGCYLTKRGVIPMSLGHRASPAALGSFLL